MVTIIYITKGKLLGTKVDEKKQMISDSFKLGWDVNTFDMSIGQLIEKLHAKKVRILLDDLYSYVLRISVPVNLREEEERKYISDKIKEKIPEVLHDEDWDYKEIQFNISKDKASQNTKDKDVIIFSPVKYLTELIARLVVNSGVEVEAIEPVEISLTRNANPIIGLALKDDINGSDRNVLNIAIEKQNREEDFKEILTGESQNEIPTGENLKDVSNSEDRGGGRSENKKAITSLLIAVIVIVLSILGYLIYKEFFLEKPSLSILQPVVTPTITSEVPTITVSIEEDVDYSQYKVMVKNGSGVKGEAQNAVKLLQESGFSGFETGNAANYNYIETYIFLNPDIPEKVFEEVSAALEQDYAVATESSILQDTEFDIEVIVGERK